MSPPQTGVRETDGEIGSGLTRDLRTSPMRATGAPSHGPRGSARSASVLAMPASASSGVARRGIMIARKAVNDFRYPLPKLRAVAQQETVPTVYFCAPDWNVPAGGIRVFYRHVDILNEAGIPAAVLHRRAGFRCTWFENHTRVVGEPRHRHRA